MTSSHTRRTLFHLAPDDERACSLPGMCLVNICRRVSSSILYMMKLISHHNTWWSTLIYTRPYIITHSSAVTKSRAMLRVIEYFAKSLKLTQGHLK